MRPALLLLPALLAACDDGGPTTPPTGLPVRLEALGSTMNVSGPPPAPTIEAAGDSVSITAVRGGSGCHHESVAAGWRDGAVLVQLVRRENGMLCLGVVERATYRIVLRPAPRGSYDVRVVERWYDLDGDRTASLDVVHGTVTIP